MNTATADDTTTAETTTSRPRRKPRGSEATKIADTASMHDAPALVASAKAPSKLDCIEALLGRSNGASIAEMIAATGWQAHSVRGAMAGAIRKRGLTVTSTKVDDLRRYRVSPAI